MGMIYVPDRMEPEVKLTIRKIRLSEMSGSIVKEERNKKKKKQKEINKKKESTYLLTRKTLKNSFENINVPTLQEIEQYLEEKQITSYSAEEFFDYYESIGWVDKSGKPIANWKAKARTWTNYQQRTKVLPKEYAKRQSMSAQASGTSTHRGSANGNPVGADAGQSLVPLKPRHQLVMETLSQKYPLPEGQMERLEGLVAQAMATGSSADLLDRLSDSVGDSAVVCWLAKALLTRAEKDSLPALPQGRGLPSGVESLSVEQIVANAESILQCAKTVYRRRLTARAMMEVLDSLTVLTEGSLSLALRNRMRK